MQLIGSEKLRKIYHSDFNENGYKVKRERRKVLFSSPEMVLTGPKVLLISATNTLCYQQ